MKKSLAHLPAEKKQELKRLREIILAVAPKVEFIILFGSHARGDWVDDLYYENGIRYTYKSDFDILVITGDKKSPEQAGIWADIEKAYYKRNRFGTYLDIIPHYIYEVNKKLRENHYFYAGIKKEGIILYDSGNFKLERKRRISPERRLEIAEEDFAQWFESANEFYLNYKYSLARGSYKIAAFELHQTTERFYATALLVCTGDRPKIHNLERLNEIIIRYQPEFMKIFPCQTAEEERLFKLLKDAYVDARYKKDYRITEDELNCLSTRVEKLREMVKKVCEAEIGKLKEQIKK
ncbi:MAG: HEPN domain-containing protein [Victivallales bacterium]|nr:HEPN domain-containing protein [Victivallales bacterium]